MAWFQLLPLAVYTLCMLGTGHVRDALSDWLPGRLDVPGAMTIASASGAVLIAWAWLLKPDLRDLSWLVPRAPVLILAAGVGFSVLNAWMEELAWRGTLFTGLVESLGTRGAILAQAIAFGYLHRGGVPRGPLGQFLAALFGLALGWSRSRGRGLLTPLVAHALIDAVIYALIAWQALS